MAVSSQLECLVRSNDALGEVPLWDPTSSKLWWIDVREPAIQSWAPASREHRRYRLAGRSIGSWGFRQRGGMILSMHDGIYAWSPESGVQSLLVPLESGMEGHRLNDGRCDRRGRFWIGTMHDTVREPRGSLYRVAPDLSVEKIFDKVDIPNSLVFSPDDRLMYFADSPAKKIWVFDFDLATGTVANRRIFVDCGQDGGVPDGSAMDADGCLWNAKYGNSRIVRYTPDGKVDRVLDLPVTQPTCCTFGGPDLGTLFITTARQKLTAEQLAPQPLAGSLFAIDVGVKGISVPGFAG